VSQGNVDLIRSLNPGTSPDLVQVFREDPERGAAARAAFEPRFHPDFECVRHDLPGGEPHFGFDGLQAMYLDWLAPWVEYRTTINEFIDCGDRVLTLQHSSGRLDGSTQEVTVDLATLWTVRGGKVARWEIYPSHAAALKAVGLEEQADA
jgi:ketosteroid isomerase-like protein